MKFKRIKQPIVPYTLSVFFVGNGYFDNSINNSSYY